MSPDPDEQGFMEFEFFIVGEAVQASGIRVRCPQPYSLSRLLRAVEEAVELPAGSILKAQVYDVETKQWFWPSSDVAPPRKTKLWISTQSSLSPDPGGHMTLVKRPVSNTCREFRDCRLFLDRFLDPLGRDIAARTNKRTLMRTTLVKVEGLHNPELERLYELRRVELFDPEARWMMPMGGPRDELKRIAACGFEPSTDPHPFGRGALVFGSDARYRGDHARPDPGTTNKLLACEVALGVPKVVSDPAPTATLESLQAQGCDSIVVTPAEGDPDRLEHTVVYHKHQVIPRMMLTYTVEFVDSELLCPDTGEELAMVSARDGSLVTVRGALEAAKDGVHFEPLHEVVDRERRLFATQQHDVTQSLDDLRTAYKDLESLHAEARQAVYAVEERVQAAVEDICTRAQAAGERLVRDMRQRQEHVTRRVDQQLVLFQMAERTARELHDRLEGALLEDSDVHFYKNLASTRSQLKKARDGAEKTRELAPELRHAIEASGQVRLDVSQVVSAIDKMEWVDDAGTGRPHEVSVERLDGRHDAQARNQESPPEAARLERIRSGARRPTQSTPVAAAAAPPPDSAPLATPPPVAPRAAAVPAVPTPVPDPRSPYPCDSQPLSPPPLHEGAPDPLPPPLPPSWIGAESTWIAPPAQPDPAVLPWDEASHPSLRRKVFACGRNDRGQLGVGAVGDVFEPTEVALPPGVGTKSICAGLTHTLFLSHEGRMYTSGGNDRGQLGRGHRLDDPTPSAVQQPCFAVTAVACGDHHSLAVTDAGGVLAWGCNDCGQLGVGEVGGDSVIPTQVQGHLAGVSVVAVAAGASHSAALTHSGVWTWGGNECRQLGLGAAANASEYPVPQLVRLPLADGVRVTGLTCGSWHTLALCRDTGNVFSWGRNEDGRLGLGHNAQVGSPQLIPSLSNASDPVMFVGASRHTSVAHTTSGSILTWGGAPSALANLPRPVPFLSQVCVLVACGGGYHHVALSVQNVLYAWGLNTSGQLGLGHDRRIDPRGALGPEVMRVPKQDGFRSCVVGVNCGPQSTFVTTAIAPDRLGRRQSALDAAG
eukprot:TRINITY_DN8048_c0_g1_i2.p1 TRINITY_DN8048_c0_g1~~TRINITY_DN8048_c0_g1_i2.p1  ORF type:complete len:1069 (+),score=234.75 TRINITY_DN8048_c0_g1_i2:53-3208(+)